MLSRGDASAGKVGFESFKTIHGNKGQRYAGIISETWQIFGPMGRLDFPKSISAMFDQAIESSDPSQDAERQFVSRDAILKILQ